MDQLWLFRYTGDITTQRTDDFTIKESLFGTQETATAYLYPQVNAIYIRTETPLSQLKGSEIPYSAERFTPHRTNLYGFFQTVEESIEKFYVLKPSGTVENIRDENPFDMDSKYPIDEIKFSYAGETISFICRENAFKVPDTHTKTELDGLLVEFASRMEL